MSDLNVSHTRLAAFITATMRAVGLPADDASTIGELMAEADLQGSDGHGVIRVPVYIRRILGGAVNVRPQIKVVEERAATALIDGDNGMGHLVMKRAAELAIEAMHKSLRDITK
jgi:LDH2 family malate/lactate/ureidoglycolate dehydrogenase